MASLSILAQPQGSYHANAISVTDDTLRAVLPPGWVVRTQMPVALDEESEPEPDVAVVRGARAELWHAHPSHPALIVEVAESSLESDRFVKGSLYVRAAIADYWIVNLVDRVVEVHRDPVLDPAAPYGWRYGSVAVFTGSGRHRAPRDSVGAGPRRRASAPGWRPTRDPVEVVQERRLALQDLLTRLRQRQPSGAVDLRERLPPA